MSFYWNRESLAQARDDQRLDMRLLDSEAAIENLAMLCNLLLCCLDSEEFWRGVGEKDKAIMQSFLEKHGQAPSLCHLEDDPEALAKILMMPDEG